MQIMVKNNIMHFSLMALILDARAAISGHFRSLGKFLTS